MKPARNPWMKFYPADWRADAMLRLCSIAARGLWAEMMCIMHEAERYGSLLVNGRRIDKKQLAGLAGISERECTALLLDLEGNGVFSRDDDGTIYSRRMRRDFEKALKDKENGKGGGNPSLKGGVNPPDNGGDKAQKPEARGQSQDEAQRSLTSSSIPNSLLSDSVEEVKEKGWTPPKHCAVSRDRKRIYIQKDTPEWEAYSADFRTTHRQEPQPNSSGGKWFYMLGEAA